MSATPPTRVDLTWTGGLTFAAATAKSSVIIDSAGVAGPSPVDALGLALAGCMCADVVHILTRGRHPLQGFRAHLVADRAQDEPHRLVRATLNIDVAGEVPRDAVERAVMLSRAKYCSVWHSLRQDLPFDVHVTVGPGAGGH